MRHILKLQSHNFQSWQHAKQCSTCTWTLPQCYSNKSNRVGLMNYSRPKRQSTNRLLQPCSSTFACQKDSTITESLTAGELLDALQEAALTWASRYCNCWRMLVWWHCVLLPMLAPWQWQQWQQWQDDNNDNDKMTMILPTLGPCCGKNTMRVRETSGIQVGCGQMSKGL